MRLFVAVDLDAAARAAVSAEQRRVAEALQGSRSPLRWVKAEQLHLTLVFLGEVADDRAPAVVEAAAPSIDSAPFGMTLQGLGVFPSHGAPRALWIGIVDGTAPLMDLQREMATRVQAAGVAIETRPFSPHLTLARWRESRPADRRAALAAATPAAIARTTVSAATLYHSRISSAGPTYTALAHATLSGR